MSSAYKIVPGDAGPVQTASPCSGNALNSSLTSAWGKDSWKVWNVRIQSRNERCQLELYEEQKPWKGSVLFPPSSASQHFSSGCVQHTSAGFLRAGNMEEIQANTKNKASADYIHNAACFSQLFWELNKKTY